MLKMIKLKRMKQGLLTLLLISVLMMTLKSSLEPNRFQQPLNTVEEHCVLTKDTADKIPNISSDSNSRVIENTFPLKIGKKRGTKKEKKQVVHSRPSKKTEQQKAKHRIIIVIMTIDSKKRRRRLKKTSDVVMAIKRNETSDLGGDAFPFFLSLSLTQPSMKINKQ